MISMFSISWSTALAWVSVGWITGPVIKAWIEGKGLMPFGKKN